LAFSVAWTGLRMLRRLANPEPEVVYRHAMEPGERWIITGRPGEPTRRERRRARRRAGTERRDRTRATEANRTS
jgi:hypothetical protein